MLPSPVKMLGLRVVILLKQAERHSARCAFLRFCGTLAFTLTLQRRRSGFSVAGSVGLLVS